MKLLINLILILSISFAIELNRDYGNSTILNGDSIILRPGGKLSDMLLGLEGLDISKNRGSKNLDSIYIRGVSQNNIMIDGVSMNDASNAVHVLGYIYPLDLNEIKINRTQNSNHLLGGEVDFITHMPSNLEALAFMGYGDPILYDMAPQNTFRGYASIGDAYFDKKFKIKLSYAWIASRGYHANVAWTKNNTNNIEGYKPSLSPNGEKIFIVGNTSRELYQNHNVRLKTNINVGDSGLLDVSIFYLNFNYNHNEEQTFLSQNGNPYFGNGGSGLGNLPYSFVGDIGSGIEHQAIESIKYKHNFKDFNLTFKILRFDGVNDFISPNDDASPSDGSGTTYNIYTQKTNINAIYSRDFLNKQIIFDFGIGYKLLQANINKGIAQSWRNWIGDIKSNINSKIFAQSHLISIFSDWKAYFLDSNLIFSFGANIDEWVSINSQNSKNEIFLSPRIALEYNPISITTLKLSLSHKNEVPNFSYMFIGRTYDDGKKILPNPNLASQNLSSLDLGIEQNIPMEGKLKIYYFLQYFNNMIYEDMLTNSYANAKNILLQGVEVSYKQPLFFNIGFFGSYTFSIHNNPNALNIPNHLGYLSLYYEDYGFFGSIGMEARAFNASSKIENIYGGKDKYILANIKIGYNFDKHISMSLEANNIFNYQYFDYQKAPGSEFFINARAKL